MTSAQPWIRFAAAVTGGVAVAMGAFAAHGVADAHARELLRTGAAYALAHVVAALAVEARASWAAMAFVAGASIFSATLYLLALGGPPMLGAVTPLGGLLMIAGWALTAWNALSRRG